MTIPKVSLEAREAAAKLYPKNSSFAKVIKSGEGDHFNSVETFAQFEQLIRSKVIDEAAGELGGLIEAQDRLLRSVLKAIDTGMNEPLEMVRDNLRSYLKDRPAQPFILQYGER